MSLYSCSKMQNSELKARALPEEYFKTSTKDTGDTLVLVNGSSNP